MENIEQLIQQAQDQDFAQANNTFAEIMAAKMNDALDQERIKVSGQIYNGLEVEDPEEEQLELDLDDEDVEVESEEDYDVDDEVDTDDTDEDSEDD
jgi:hypothetical protein